MPTESLSNICNQSLDESKAENVIILDVRTVSSFADEIIIATANSNRHATSVSNKLVEYLKEKKINIIGVEGESSSGWILVDCGDVVINIMKQEQREFYDLESLWVEMMPSKEFISSSKLSTKEIIKKESAILLNNIPQESYVISWDSEGKQISSLDFANLIKQKIKSQKSISFLVGGSHGFTNEVKHKSDMVLSASLLTFPHKLFRLILVEQIYRAHTILANMPYHK